MKHEQSLRIIAGANLKRLINEAGLTQEKAAQKLHFSEGSSIRRLYREGISNVDEIGRIAKAFGVTVNDMLTID